MTEFSDIVGDVHNGVLLEERCTYPAKRARKALQGLEWWGMYSSDVRVVDYTLCALAVALA